VPLFARLFPAGYSLEYDARINRIFTPFSFIYRIKNRRADKLAFIWRKWVPYTVHQVICCTKLQPGNLLETFWRTPGNSGVEHSVPLLSM
jgi:hypothetical protein